MDRINEINQKHEQSQFCNFCHEYHIPDNPSGELIRMKAKIKLLEFAVEKWKGVAEQKEPPYTDHWAQTTGVKGDSR